MKKFLLILSLILFVSCDLMSIQKVSKVCDQPEIGQITEDNIQYDIEWKLNDVDVRIVTLTKNGIKHDYVIATSCVNRGSGLSIEHWEGCECKN